MKITTLIPAYKPKYLYELLAAIVQQTVLPDKVIFSDDSPDRVFTSLLSAEPVRSMIAHLNIEVIEGPRKGGHANFCHIINYFNRETELVHLLCDDDIIYPHFYERHLHAHKNGEFSSSISRRWTANELGQPLRQGLSVPEMIKYHPNRNIALEADFVFASTVGQSKNWLGEVSNTVYRAAFSEKIISRNIFDISYAGLEDLGSFIDGTLSLPLCFINEHLGFFRQSPQQNSSQHFGPPLKAAFLAYIALAIAGRRIDKISGEMAHETIKIVGSNIAWHYRNELDMNAFCQIMPELMSGVESAEENFLKLWANCDLINQR